MDNLIINLKARHPFKKFGFQAIQDDISYKVYYNNTLLIQMFGDTCVYFQRVEDKSVNDAIIKVFGKEILDEQKFHRELLGHLLGF